MDTLLKMLRPAAVAVLMASLAHATPQSGDLLHYRGAEYTVHGGCGLDGSPVGPFLKAHPEVLSNSFNTACWNGYYPEWRIEKGVLYLVAIHKGNGGEIPLSMVFTNQTGSIPATWFNGKLHCPRLRLWPTYNAIGGDYAYWVHFVFQRGKLESITRSTDSFLKRLTMNCTSLACVCSIIVLFVRGLFVRRNTDRSCRCGWWCLRLGLVALLPALMITSASMAATLWTCAVDVVGAAQRAVFMLEKASELHCLVAASAVALLGLIANVVLDRPRERDKKCQQQAEPYR